MPPLSARIPTVEFRSLLLPPVRIPLRALQSLHRPQCLPRSPTGGNPPHCLAQRRHLVLYKTAKSDTVLGQHKLLPFELYPIPPLGSSDQLVNIQTLADEQGRKTLVENITLQDAYDNYVKPGHLLVLLSEITKKVAEKVETLKQEKTYLSNSTYGIVKAESIPSNIKSPTAGKGQGALRVTPVNLASTKSYFTLALDRSHQFIRHGSPVEFTIRLKGGYDKTTDKLEFQGHENWTWLHNHFPHLRPDFILKSMPEGSRFVVDPVSICHCQTVTCLSCGPQLDCTTVQDQGGSQDFNRERTAGAIAKASPIHAPAGWACRLLAHDGLAAEPQAQAGSLREEVGTKRGCVCRRYGSTVCA
jgi:hypothetical protein